jgi:hypothetical protein
MVFFGFSQKIEFNANRIAEKISVDGHLTEDVWSKFLTKESFVTSFPVNGDDSKHLVEMAVLYDDQNLYVGAKLYDMVSDSISYSLSPRDQFGNGDWFGFLIDPYQTSINAFGFYSTASGVQIDELRSDEESSFNWNAVWRNKTAKFDGGWSVEFKIPFAAIRFPKENIQEWNINFIREIRRDRERSSWSPVDQNAFGELTQMGKLIGIENVKVPIRLSFTPYLAGSITHYNDKNSATKDWSYGYGGGVDLKYGVTESFTLDMTLVPDFSQVRSDNQVLNLSAFEVKFDENRPFFTEGTELFSIGNLFYSRRLGDRPLNYSLPNSLIDTGIGEQVIENPLKSKLINATKLSGRTKGGLGIGFFNGIERRARAIIADSNGNEIEKVLTNPLTNYNVLVLSQNLSNTSKVSFVNANTWREGHERKANVSWFDFNFVNSLKTYGFNGGLGLSLVHQNKELTIGHKLNLGFGKLSGNWRYDVLYSEESDTYDPNDLGYLSRNNARRVNLNVTYKKFEPWRNLLKYAIYLNASHERLYKPNVSTLIFLEARSVLTFKNFLTAGATVNLEPIGSYDYFEPRVWGAFHRTPLKFAFGGFISSDYSKTFAIDADVEVALYGQDQRIGINFGFDPRIRISDRWFFVYSFNFDFVPKQRGVVLNKGSVMYENNRIIYSKRDRRTVTNELTMEFLFTRNMGIDFRMRHYWSTVHIDSYHQLLDNGYLMTASYSGLDDDGVRLHDQNYNAFTIDFVYSWIFAPGSELNLTWKQSIYTSGGDFEDNFVRNTKDIFNQPMTNSLSLKILYYLDVLYFKKKNRKKKDL